jgi:SAM-dependent methyltransferase
VLTRRCAFGVDSLQLTAEDAPLGREDHDNCILCGGGTWSHEASLARLVALPDDGLLRCCQCGLIRRRAIESISLSCTPEYLSTLAARYPAPQEARVAFVREKIARLAARAGVASPRVLEVGPGRGLFAEMARAAGWRMTLIEADPGNASFLQHQGHAVIRGQFDQSLPEELGVKGPFDAVYANHVLEHVVDPVAFVRNAKAVLTPSGVALVEVPNEGDSSYIRLMRRLPLPLPIPRNKSEQVTPTQHNYFFRPRVLRRLFEMEGFCQLEVTTRESPALLALLPTALRAYRWVDGLMGRGSRIEVVARAGEQ